MSISAHNIRKSFNQGIVLDGVSLEIESGELIALLGPSGSGKTTLLRILSGLERPDSGTVKYHSEDVTSAPPQSRNVGLVFQHYALFRHMTVFENVAFALRIRKRPHSEVQARVKELLELVHLAGFAEQYPHQLSGGQRQRVALARVLAVEPRVLLLDEPFGALDTQVRRELRKWLRRLHDDIGVTTILVTHDHLEARDVADRVVVINKGTIEQEGEPGWVFSNPANEFVAEFLS